MAAELGVDYDAAALASMVADAIGGVPFHTAELPASARRLVDAYVAQRDALRFAGSVPATFMGVPVTARFRPFDRDGAPLPQMPYIDRDRGPEPAEVGMIEGEVVGDA
jgi:hypothetical protein